MNAIIVDEHVTDQARRAFWYAWLQAGGSFEAAADRIANDIRWPRSA